MKLEKSIKREEKRKRRQHGHVTTGRSVFIIQEIEKQKAIKIEREEKEKQK